MTQDRHRTNIIPLDCRADAETSIDKKLRYKQIKEILRDLGAGTAKMIAIEMHARGYTSNDDRNNAAPRLSEMTNRTGEVEPIGKTRCLFTGKTVTLYRLRETE